MVRTIRRRWYSILCAFGNHDEETVIAWMSGMEYHRTLCTSCEKELYNDG